MVESLSYVLYYYLELSVYGSERMGSRKNGTSDYVDVVVLEVVQKFGVDLRWAYIAFLQKFRYFLR